MRERLPGAIELVYDNYNALAIGYGPTERASEAIFSIAVYPRSVGLCFIYGAELDDRRGLLQGAGNQTRFVRLPSVDVLDRPEMRELMDQALARARVPLDPDQPYRLVIKSISAKQRPRRV
jgi:hypothetical protein